LTGLKSRDIDRFIQKPDIKSGFVLVYGPDQGRVRETTDILQKHFHPQSADPMALVSLQYPDLENAAETIVVEAQTPSMFGDQRVIRVRGATNALAKDIDELVSGEMDAILLVEAGNLTPKDALRKLAESKKTARALPCYADDERSLNQLARQMFDDAGVFIDADALRALIDILGNDRQITRLEVEKLILFAAETKKVTYADVVTLCGDNAAETMDDILDSTGTGHMQKLDTALARAFSSGTHPSAILSRALYHFMNLREMRAVYDGGQTTQEIVNNYKYRVHFARKRIMESQIRTWNAHQLGNVCERIQQTILSTRQNPSLEFEHTRQALLAIATIAARN
jgi:DNA polymerase-3 subunit delta